MAPVRFGVRARIFGTEQENLGGVISALFAAIYKILPDKPIAWWDVAIGSVVTAILFTIGKSLIGLYIGSSGVASSYGAAGALHKQGVIEGISGGRGSKWKLAGA